MRTAKAVTDLQWADPYKTAVSMTVHFEELDDLGPIPFVAHPDDCHAHGRQLYARALSGEFGPIASSLITVAEHLAAIKEQLCKRLDASAAASHGSLSPVHQHKLDEARRIASVGHTADDDYPFLNAMVGHEGDTLHEVAVKVRDEDAAWRKRAAQIERALLDGKKAINAAADEAGARAAFEAVKF